MKKAKERFAHSHESLAREFGSIRAGRANASLLDRITVEYYGAPTPLNQLASITVPEARVLLISPFDKGSIADIERAINESDLGINPANDGSVVRLVIPALTEETRKELAKEVKKVGENAKIAIRNIRRDAMDEAKKQEKDKEITEDQLKSLEKDIQKATDDAVKKIDSMTAEKEKRTSYCLINRKIRRVGQKQKSMNYVSFLVRLSFRGKKMNTLLGTIITALVTDENDKFYFAQKDGVTFALSKKKGNMPLATW